MKRTESFLPLLLVAALAVTFCGCPPQPAPHAPPGRITSPGATVDEYAIEAEENAETTPAAPATSTTLPEMPAPAPETPASLPEMPVSEAPDGSENAS